MEEGPEVIKRYNFHKGNHLTEEEEKKISYWLDNVKSTLPAQESNITLERLEDIDSIIIFINEWVKKNLNISLANRMPLSHRIKFYSPNEYEILRKKMGLDPNNTGHILSSVGEMRILETENKSLTLSIFTHEFIYQSSMNLQPKI